MTEQSRVWVIRANDGKWADEFADNGYIGIHHGMDGVDMSRVGTHDEVRQLFIQEHPNEKNDRSIGNRVSQIAKFHLEIKSGDFVLTPGLDGEIRYGRFSTNDCYYVSDNDGLPTRNRRLVEWSDTRLDRRDLPSRALQGGTTLYEVGDTSGLRAILDPIANSIEPNVWIIRGGRDGRAIDEFLAGKFIGVGFGFADYDVSKLRTEEDLLQFCENRGLRTDGVDQSSRFLADVTVGDYVLMPGLRSRLNHYGRIASDPYHDQKGTHNNRRDVEWSPNTITQSELDLSGYRHTVTLPNRDVRDRFLEIIGGDLEKASFKMPEDSWVPFHLEVGRKLVEEEMWKPEMREIFGNLVGQVMFDAGIFEMEGVTRWTSDPYSFYLAFNTATQERRREAGYAQVQEMFRIAVDKPERGHYARQYPVHYWGEMRPESTGVSLLWDFFRFVRDADPVNDADDAAEFVKRFDVTISSDVPGMASATLSQWLYWIDPTKYLLPRRIYWRELGLAKELGIKEPFEGGTSYLAALKAVSEFAESKGKTILDVNRDSTTRETLGLNRDEDEGGVYGIEEMIKEGVFLEPDEVERMMRILRSKKNLILQGPPGVGKTFIAKKLAYALMGSASNKRITGVQFHQSYSYEDFVGGFRPDVEQDKMVFKPKDGPFLQVCEEARAHDGDDYVVLIDEINRGNLSRVFGELLMLIEADKRKAEFGVKLQHRPDDDEGFFVPENVYIIGTMNLADKSLTGMNVAMRRRFGFYDLEPQFGKPKFKDWLSNTEMPQEMQDRINQKMSGLNNTISKDDSLDFNYAVGHSFFCPPQNEPRSRLGRVVRDSCGLRNKTVVERVLVR